MKKAFILIFSLLLTAAFVLCAAAVGAGGAFPEYGEDASPFYEYSEEFTYPDINDKWNDGVYTYGDDEYFYGYDDGDFAGLDKMAEISATFMLISVLVSVVLLALLIIFAVMVARGSKKLKRYREIESAANGCVMYYDPTGKISPTPDFAARQNGAYGYLNGNPENNPNNGPFGYRENDFGYQNGGFNGQNADFNNPNGYDNVNGGFNGE